MITDNNPPKDAADYEAPLDTLKDRLSEFELGNMDDARASELNDLIKDIQALNKSAENDRKAIKEPYLLAGRKVDADFKPIKTRADSLVKSAKAILTPYLVEQARIAKEAREAAEREAAEKARIAEQLKQDALVGDSVVKESEEAAANLAMANAKEVNAGRAGSSSGTSRTASLRTYRYAEITDPEKAAVYFCTHPSVQDAIISAANAIIRNAKGGFVKMDGIEIKEEQRVA